MSREQREQLDRLLREGPLDLGGDIAVQRPLLEQLLTAHPLPGDVTTETGVLGGVPVVRIEVGDAARTSGDRPPVLLFFHGGGYVMGSAIGVAGMAADLARRCGATAVSVEYRLAPEHPHPAALEDAVAAYRALVDEGVPADRIAVAGESAGAGLAVALLLSARQLGLPQPACGVLFSPWVDLALTGRTMTSKADVDPALSADRLRRRVIDYVGAADPAQPLVSPVNADLRGLAPLLIQVGSHEVLLDDAVRLAAVAATADVSVELQVTPGVPHVFQGFAAVLDEATTALDRAGSFLGTHLQRASRARA